MQLFSIIMPVKENENKVEIFDASYKKDLHCQKIQPRLCMSHKLKPLIMDINDTYFQGEAVANIKALDITKKEILPTCEKQVKIIRGKSSFELKVIGLASLNLYHAKGRAHRAKANIDLE